MARPRRSAEFLQMEAWAPSINPSQATYFFDLRPDLIGRVDGYVFKVSDCLHSRLNPKPPGWVGVIGTDEEPDPAAPDPYALDLLDDDARPPDAPLRVRTNLPHLEPHYGDGYVAFLIYRDEVL